MSSGQRPELRVRFGLFEVDAKGLAAIRAARTPVIFMIAFLSAGIVVGFWGLFELGAVGKAVEFGKAALDAALSEKATLVKIGSAILGLATTAVAGVFAVKRMRKSTVLK